MNNFLVLLLLLASCTFKKGSLGNQTQEGHEELYSMPKAPEVSKLEKGLKRIVIAATNDIEGHYAPHAVEFKDKHNKEKQKLTIGGAEIMAHYFDVLRETYQNVVLVDSGDIFPPSGELEKVQKFYASQKYDAITIGLGDFNLRLPGSFSSNSKFFQKFAQDSPTPLVLSNLYELKTARLVEWKGASPYVMKEVDGVKVGIIGLIPDDIATLTPVDSRIGLFVEGMLQSTLRQARLLRSIGADVIVVLTHQGIPCGHSLAQDTKLPLAKVNFEPRDKEACEVRGVLGAYLERLPPNLVDVVIGGRHNEKMANFINGILVLSSFEHGKSMSFAELIVDTQKKKVISDQIVVHQPVMFCHEFFKETNDCWPYDNSINHKERIPAQFLGRTIENNKAPKTSYSREAPYVPNYLKGMSQFKADLTFLPNTSGKSQLVKFSISGKTLIELLEKEYNLGNEENWHPNPFFIKDQFLQLYVQGNEIKTNKNYSILADLESLQSNTELRKWIIDSSTQSLVGHSWASLSISDSVETKIAAPSR